MLLEICERSICEIVQLLGVEIVVGVGKFAQERARVALKAAGMDWIRVETIMHPSPANPMANKGWDAIAEKQLEDMGVMAIIKSSVRPPTPKPPTPPPQDTPEVKEEEEREKTNGSSPLANGTGNESLKSNGMSSDIRQSVAITTMSSSVPLENSLSLGQDSELPSRDSPAITIPQLPT